MGCGSGSDKVAELEEPCSRISGFFLSQCHSSGGGFIHAVQSLTNESSLIQIVPFVWGIVKVKVVTGLNPSKRFYSVWMPESIQKTIIKGIKFIFISIMRHWVAMGSMSFCIFLAANSKYAILFLTISINISPESRLYVFFPF